MLELCQISYQILSPSQHPQILYGHLKNDLISPDQNRWSDYHSGRLNIDPLSFNIAGSPEIAHRIVIVDVGYPSILCALRTGLRIGEIQALKWVDIDFDDRQIEVKRSYRKGRMTGTKNHKRRRVDMTMHLTQTLKDHRTAQKRDALKKGKPVSEFVFAGVRDELINRSSFQNALNRCTERAGLRQIRTHSLRHSYATIRLMKGHNVGDVSYQLGHSSIKITYDIYDFVYLPTL